jgi:hypothetical protein
MQLLWYRSHPFPAKASHRSPAGAGAPLHSVGSGWFPPGIAQGLKSVLGPAAHWVTRAPSLGALSPLTGLPGHEHGRSPGNNSNFQSPWSQKEIPGCQSTGLILGEAV